MIRENLKIVKQSDKKTAFKKIMITKVAKMTCLNVNKDASVQETNFFVFLRSGKHFVF